MPTQEKKFFEHSKNLLCKLSVGQHQKAFNFEGSDLNVQCIYISTPENTKIMAYHLIIVSVAKLNRYITVAYTMIEKVL